MLDLLGLTPLEEALYQDLLGRRPCDKAELAELVPGLTESELDTLLAGMERKGLVRWVAQAVVAVSPDVVLGEQLTTVEDRLRRAKLHVQSLSERHRTGPPGNPAPPVELVPPADVLERYFALSRTATTEVRALETPPYATDGRQASDQSDNQARGVSYRIVYGRAAVESQGLDLLTGCIAAGEQARVVGEVPLKMLLIDDRRALIPARTGRLLTEGMLVVSGGALLDALSALFEAVWAQALPLNLDPDSPRPHPGTDDDTIIALLGAGLGDRAIAHHLGVGLRTIQRRIHDIMSRLNAVTRFQAGLAAGTRSEVRVNST